MIADSNLLVGSSVLVLAPELPWPPRDGGRIVLDQLLGLLVSLGCRLSIAAFAPTAGLHDKPAVPILLANSIDEIVLVELTTRRVAVNTLKGVLARLPVKFAKYADPRFLASVSALLDRRSFDFVIADHLHLASLLPLAKIRRIPTVLRQHNVESRIASRFLDRSFGSFGRLTGEGRRYQEYESRTVADATLTLAISDTDAAELRRSAAKAQVGTLSPYVEIRSETPLPTGDPFVLFLGSLDWAPNIESVTFLARDIMPILRADWPGARCRVVGKGPSRTLERVLARAGVELYADVPDVGAFLVPWATLVVPLFVGSGVRIKILQAMAHRVPVVTSAIGIEGLPCRDREHVLLAEHAEDFAAAVHSIWSEPQLATSLTEASSAIVARHFSRETSLRQLAHHLAGMLYTST